MVAIADFLGQGLYTPSEVALYVRETPAVVNRWLLGRAGAPVVERQFIAEERFVSFLDFVQTLAIAAIRRQYKVPLQTIREGVDEAKKSHGVDYPFALQHKTFLLQRVEKGGRTKSEGEVEKPFRKFELLISRPDETLVQLTGKHRGNLVMKEVVELYLSDLTFSKDGLAIAYTAWRHAGRELTMNPRRGFGEPLTPSGYTAHALAEAVVQEGSIERAAKAYGVDREEVELAYGYLDYLKIVPQRG